MAIQIKIPKKLIEVALPLNDINEAAGREKSIRHGHPSTMHLWWARRPLAAARAVIFAQMVNDPGGSRGYGPGMTKAQARIERERLFDIIRKLVLWENMSNEGVLNEARNEIWRSWRETCELNKAHPDAATLFDPNKLPAFHDPFAGGGAIPLEAQRLGLESHASDLNPVAVMLNKAMIEIPSRFIGSTPIGPIRYSRRQEEVEEDWSGARGLAEDIRRYGKMMRDIAIKRIGHLYPQVALPKKFGGGSATVLVWLWARTVKSPNPAFAHIAVPIATNFVLSMREGKEAYVKPIVSGDSYSFEVVYGIPPEEASSGTKLSRGANFRCLMSGTPIDAKYIKAEAKAGRMGARLMAIVAEGPDGRVYLSPSSEIEDEITKVNVTWRPDITMSGSTQYLGVKPYGMDRFDQLFTDRQLVVLSAFTDIVQEVRASVINDFEASGRTISSVGLAQGGTGSTAYGDAVSVYLALAASKETMFLNTLSRWRSGEGKTAPAFGRQAIAMVWDFADVNPFAGAGGDFAGVVEGIAKSVAGFLPAAQGFATQQDAQTQRISFGKLVSTDPPYYDNVPYADLSDYFYVWLRRSLRNVFPSLFSTMAVPKAEELVAFAYRHNDKDGAEAFFLNGMKQAMNSLANQVHPAFPTTIYYAFKQSDTSDIGTGNTGWETFLDAVISAGFVISGTWPMNTESVGRLRGQGANALASSIVLVCGKRAAEAPQISRRDFIRELREELNDSIELMIGGGGEFGSAPVAPVDLAQAVIGPGMAIFSKYSSVLEADGSLMSVHTALTLINRMLTEDADEFDADTQFCLGWFNENGWSASEFGQADVLARAKGTSVAGVKDAGVIEAGAGKVRLFKPIEYPEGWTPVDDNRTPVWEALHQMIKVLRSKGESESGRLLAGMPQRAEPIRNLAYRLYTLCERKGWTDEARAYNELITSWTGIEVASHEKGHFGAQANLDI